jgi:hypothetical protein
MTRSPLFWLALGAAGFWGYTRYRASRATRAA